MDDYNDIEEAMRCGINSLSDTTDDAELESELNELIEQDKSESARNDLKLPEVLANSNTVRVGKRVLDFDLPAVPSSGPSTSREASPNKPEFSLEERWKRLRMEAS
jgi:hypothetical protein